MRLLNPLKIIVVGVGIILVSSMMVQSADAVVYKWKDNDGHTYFTDDLNKVPLQFRSMSSIETVRGTGDLSSNVTSAVPQTAPADKQVKATEPKRTAKPESNSKRDEAKRMYEEKPLLREVTAHFENEIARDEELTTYLPTMINGKTMVESVGRMLPTKKALADKISTAELPSLKAAFSFLSASAESDAREKISVDQGMQTRTYQLLERLKVELTTIKQLVSQLRAETLRIDQVLAVPGRFTPPPEFPKMEVIETPETAEIKEAVDAGKAEAVSSQVDEVTSNSVGESEGASALTDKGGAESLGKISDILKKGGIKIPKID